MKNVYEHPIMNVDLFEWDDVLTNSGIGAGDGVLDTLNDEPTDEPIA